MEDQQKKAKFVSRSIVLGGNAKTFSPSHSASGTKARSQWHGMDLHTTTPSTNRRAMYTPTSTPPPQNVGSGGVSPAAIVSPSSTGGTKIKAEDAAISARNLMIRRKLSERKRFDSADHAMKTMMKAMHAPDPQEAHEATPSSTPAGSPPQSMTNMESPRLSPSHARMGAFVFKDALNDGDYEMKDAEPEVSVRIEPQPVQQQQQQRPSAATARYGGLGKGGISASGAVSARNIMIQKRMHEKRHFDSADWQLAKNGVSTDAVLDAPPEPPAHDRQSLQINNKPTPMEITPASIASPASSPSAARAAAMRNAHLYAQMSPSVRSSADSHQSNTNYSVTPDESKYAGLSGSNELLQRRLAEKKRFDSADYNMVQATRSQPSSDSQLRRTTLLRQQQNFLARQEDRETNVPAPPQHNFFATPTAAPPAPMQQTPLAAASDAASATSKYGKLCAANVLLRKKLKDRKRFDSADYQMERAKQTHEIGGTSGVTDSSISTEHNPELNSPTMNPQTKHIKLSDGAAAPSRWASHAAVVAMRSNPGQVTATSQPTRDASAAQPVSLESRLAARSVLIHRHLAERKRFDSADHFSAKEAAMRGRQELNRHQS